MLGIPHPYLTAALPGIGGEIKFSLEDFLVTEVPLYTPCGHGEHTYFEVEKVDLSTLEALERLSRELRRDIKEFGYAGLKDRKGITRQTFSIAHVDPSVVEGLRLPQITVLWARLHGNKLRVGHLKGNHFKIRIRGVSPDCEQKAADILRVIEREGLPNYYGQQRFGNRGDAHKVGRAFLKKDDRAAIRRILGSPAKTEQNPNVVRARELFMTGDFEGAARSYPSTYREERRLLAYLCKAGENYAGARKRLGDAVKKLYFTAYQSYLFNLALSRRLLMVRGDLGLLWDGDLAFIHRNGAVFTVTDVVQEEPRARAFEISPSGPIFGMRMVEPGGIEGEIEKAILEREGTSPVDFHQLMPRLRLEGGRRPLRVKVENLTWRLEGSDLNLEFFLPKGSYATTLLREILKREVVPDAFYEEGEEEKHSLWRPPSPSAGAPGLEGEAATAVLDGE
jgi:tRNA pseudouridine13 synthase